MHWQRKKRNLQILLKLVEHIHKMLFLLNLDKSLVDIEIKLQQHLAIDPSSARGWYLLGRLYASQHLWEKSYQALGKAYELKPQDDLIAVNFAQSLFARQNPEDDALARKILTATLVAHPQQADALLMLAIDAQHRHATQEALTYWRRLLILVPDSSPEAESIRKTIHDLMGSE